VQRDYRVISGCLLVVGVLTVLFGIMIGEFEYPGYSVAQNALSDLGATCRAGVCRVYTPSSYLFNGSLLITGALVALSSAFMYRVFRSRLLSTLLGIAGAAAFGVGIFPESAGSIHGELAGITFLAMGLAAIYSLRYVSLPMKLLSVILGGLTVVLAVLFEMGLYFSFGFGGMERLVVYPTLFWGLIFGGYLINLGTNIVNPTQSDSR